MNLIGATGLTLPKAAGAGLALAAFLPAFLFLRAALVSGNFNRILATFVAGFFFKLLFVLIGLYLLILKASFPLIDTATGCMLFLIVMQIFESLYFWKIWQNQA
ncbi:MAG: hypothetical protein FJY65_04110 [Calditrichaeota bacterium]|nr:hypothetical protein [Calditrichota bacterium]